MYQIQLRAPLDPLLDFKGPTSKEKRGGVISEVKKEKGSGRGEKVMKGKEEKVYGGEGRQGPQY